MVATPPVLIAFDVLYVKGRDVSQRPLHERRGRLEEVVASAGFIYPVRRLAPDGLDAWAEVVDRGYEGLVATTDVPGGPFCRIGSFDTTSGSRVMRVPETNSMSSGYAFTLVIPTPAPVDERGGCRNRSEVQQLGE